MAWDTAFEKNNRADYSACTIWGVFNHPDETGNRYRSNLISVRTLIERSDGVSRA
jgi:phage terminase large subunit-like protein